MSPLRRRPRAPLRAALLIDAPPARVRDAVWSTRTWTRAAASCGWLLQPAGRAPAARGPRPAPPAGDSAVASGPEDDRMTDGQRWRLRRGRRASAEGQVAAGAAPGSLRLAGTGWLTGWSVTVTVGDTRAGSLVTVDLRTGTRRHPSRGTVVRAAQRFLGIVLLEATVPDVGTHPAGHLGETGDDRRNVGPE